MKKFLVILGCFCVFLSACDNQKAEETPAPKATEQTEETVSQEIGNWQDVAGEPEKFAVEFNKLDDVQKYYFCAAFSMGAMSVSKPATASAMVNYFLGLGVAKYNRGIDDDTYKAFDFGKNIFRYELIVNDILDKKTCENIMIEATEFAKEKGFAAEELNDKGEPELEKIRTYIQK